MIIEFIILITGCFAVLVFAPLRKVFFPLPLVSTRQEAIIQRLPYFDFLKGAAILAVVSIHSADIFLDKNLANNTNFFYFINNLSRFAIPFFFICSGLLLSARYPEKIPLKKFYYGRLLGVFFPYLILNIVIALAKKLSITDFLYNIISGNGLLPYYFIVVLFQFYLIFPIIVRFKDSRLFLFGTFFISLICFFFPQAWGIYGIQFMGRFLFFFVYGMYMRNYFLSEKIDSKNNPMIWVLFIFIYFLVFFVFSGYYYNTRIFYGLAVFNLFFIYKKQITSLLPMLYKLLCQFGQNSLWIFLVHFPIISLIYWFLLFFNFEFYIFFILVFIFSAVLSFFAGKFCCIVYNRFLSFFKIKKFLS